MSNKRIKVVVKEGDALSCPADVLALKFAQALYGLDNAVVDRLGSRNVEVDFGRRLPNIGSFCLLETLGAITAKEALFISVEPLHQFEYKQIREFARHVLKALAGARPGTKHLCLTIHGPGYGLDETEAFESELAGLIDAITTLDFPKDLEQVTFIERNKGRANRLQFVLNEFLPRGYIDANHLAYLSDLGELASEKVRSVGYSSESKPHVFVAMPFADEMEDLYHYGIQGAVKSAGFLCERADLSAYTGDVLEWIKERIKTATLVVADLSSANPNVYLEVGYAWGCGVPTVLLVNGSDNLRFDVQSQRCLVYSKIKDLEIKLSAELQSLYGGKVK